MRLRVTKPQVEGVRAEAPDERPVRRREAAEIKTVTSRTEVHDVGPSTAEHPVAGARGHDHVDGAIPAGAV